MEGSISDHTLPRWMSVTGQPLELGLDSGFRGKQRPRMFELLNNLLGRCLSIGSYEKLNQLGEGSRSTLSDSLMFAKHK